MKSYRMGKNNDLHIFYSKSMTPLIGPRKWQLVYVYSNGTVALPQPAAYDTACDIDVQRFPFDSQMCRIYLSTYSIDFNLSPGKLLDKRRIRVSLCKS
jgi:hypothetical protein